MLLYSCWATTSAMSYSFFFFFFKFPLWFFYFILYKIIKYSSWTNLLMHSIIFQRVTIHLYLYNTKSWSVAFNVATLTLSHISNHVITPFFLIFFHNFNILLKRNYSQPYLHFKAQSLLLYITVNADHRKAPTKLNSL